MIAHVTLWTVATIIPTGEPELRPNEMVPLSIAALLTVVVGLWVAYRANGGDEGRDLAGRLLALSWVLGLRVLALLFCGIVLAGLSLAVSATMASREISHTAIDAAAWTLGLSYVLVFFWRLAHHLRDLRRPG
jgi:hypothetical protein